MNAPATATNITELRKNGGMKASKAGANTVARYFAIHQKQIQSVLPAHVKPERMLRLALSAISKTPTLADCTMESLLGALLACSQLGLEPNTPLGHAYLVPFWDGKNKQRDVQLIPGYRGLIDLARRSGQIISISAHAVYEGDDFDFAYGLDERLTHKPARTGRGEIIAAYAVAKLQGGGHQFEVMYIDDINKIREKSQGAWFADRNSGERKPKPSSPWWSHYEAMARKTVIRRLVKFLPVSIEMAKIVELDEQADRGEQNLGSILDGDYTVEQPTNDADKEPERLPLIQIPEQHADAWITIQDAFNEGGTEHAKKVFHGLNPTQAKALDPHYKKLIGE